MGGGGGSVGRVGLGGQGRCEQRSEVLVKIQIKNYFFFLGGGGVQVGGGVRGWSQGGCEQRIEIFVIIQKKKWRGAGGLGRGVEGVRVDVTDK